MYRDYMYPQTFSCKKNVRQVWKTSTYVICHVFGCRPLKHRKKANPMQADDSGRYIDSDIESE